MLTRRSICRSMFVFVSLCLHLGLGLGLLVAHEAAAAPSAGPAITVFAAASMTDALQALAANYKATTGKSVRFSFAGSSVRAL